MTSLGHLNNSTSDPRSSTTAGKNGWELLGQPVLRARGGWIWTGSGPIQNLKGLIPKKSDWTSLGESHFGINDAGKIVGTGYDPSVRIRFRDLYGVNDRFDRLCAHRRSSTTQSG